MAAIKERIDDFEQEIKGATKAYLERVAGELKDPLTIYVSQKYVKPNVDIVESHELLPNKTIKFNFHATPNRGLGSNPIEDRSATKSIDKYVQGRDLEDLRKIVDLLVEKGYGNL